MLYLLRKGNMPCLNMVKWTQIWTPVGCRVLVQ